MHLPAQFDEDLLDYVNSMISEMSLDEKVMISPCFNCCKKGDLDMMQKSDCILKDTIGPFLQESGYFESDEEILSCCKK